jgi:cardiolipin synthase
MPSVDTKPARHDLRGWLAQLYARWRGRSKGARNFRVLFYLSMVALVLQSGLLFLALFEPGLPYTISRAPAERLDSREFLHVLSSLTHAAVRHYDNLEVLTNGEVYYEAELAAIRTAKRSINLEAYIFQKGEVTRRFIDALTDRARAGVKVNVLLDAVGSAAFRAEDMKSLLDAGGRLAWYHPLRWHTWHRMNNRTHRELIIIDGVTGFAGGSGFADHWLLSTEDDPRWRDTMVRVDGEVVSALQAVFAVNWLEGAGEILTGREYFPVPQPVGTGDRALVVASSPGAGRSTAARVLFQTLLHSAQHRISITTPYFLPDSSVRDELVRAIKDRGVTVEVVVPGHKSDHALTRNSSRRLYGDLLEAGAKIYEYQPAMNHTKSLVIDSLWAVVGSTNMDSRSFGLNDEVNLAVADPMLAARLEQDFLADVAQSRRITYEQWLKRPMLERAQEYFGWLLERQQ